MRLRAIVLGALVWSALALAGFTPTIRADLDRTSIQRVIRGGHTAFQRCYEQALARNPAAQGRVTVRFTVEGNGKVGAVTIDSLEIGDPEMDRCLVRVFKRLRFPGARGSRISIAYPLVFRPPP